MNQLLYFIRRNLRLFCGNRLNILLSFASVLIVIGIYMLFLRDFLLDTVTRAGVESTFVKEFTDRFMLAGLLIVVNTTTCFGILQLSVADTETGIRRDYLVAPVSHFSLTIGYWVTAVLISFFLLYVPYWVGSYFSYALSPCAARHKPLPNSRNRSVFLYDKCRHPPMPLPEAEKYGHIFHPGKPLWHSNRLSRRSLSALFLLSQLAARHAFYFPPTQAVSVLRQLYTEHLRIPLAQHRPAEFLPALLQSFGIELRLHGSCVAMQRQYGLMAFLFCYSCSASGLAGSKINRCKKSTGSTPLLSQSDKI